MAVTEVYNGDDFAFPVTVGTTDENGVFTARVVDSAATVRASLIGGDETILLTAVSVLESNTGSDWPNGIVVAVFLATTTESLTPQDAFLEFEIDDSGLISYQSDSVIRIKKAFIPNL